MPKVTASILEAMDRVAREAADTVGKLLNNNNNSYSTRHSHDQSLFHKLEVSWIIIADSRSKKCHWWAAVDHWVSQWTFIVC